MILAINNGTEERFSNTISNQGSNFKKVLQPQIKITQSQSKWSRPKHVNQEIIKQNNKLRASYDARHAKSPLTEVRKANAIGQLQSALQRRGQSNEANRNHLTSKAQTFSQNDSLETEN